MTSDIPLNGKCTFMDITKREFKIRDEEGQERPFNWTEPLDVVMTKNGQPRWKPGFYLTVTFDPETHIVKNVVYWKEGASLFPKESRGGRSYTPRNERAGMAGVLLKVYGELQIATGAGADFKSSRKELLDAVEDSVKEMQA